jgi:hypothetical protein
VTLSAILSSCGKYRYRLERTVRGRGETYGFFGVNPSTADATINDQTVKKWIGFTDRWNGGRFMVGNVFAYRATDVGELARAVDPVGPDNDLHLERIVREADILVPCWGKIDKVPRHLRGRFDDLIAMLCASGKPVMHLGLNACGSPKHPQMLGYKTPLRPWVADLI